MAADGAHPRTGAGGSSCRSRKSRSSRDLHPDAAAPARSSSSLERREDERGFFARTLVQREFEAHGLEPGVVQCNVSFNQRTRHAARHALPGGAARGGEAGALHARRVYDVIVDLRPVRRPTPALRRRAHRGDRAGALHPGGLRARLPDARGRHRGLLPDVASSTSRRARGVRWNDPAFGIAWPMPIPPFIERDRSYPDFRRTFDAREEPVNAPDDGAGEAMHALRRRALPDLPQHHRRRRARDPRGACSELVPLELTEVPTGTAGLRLDGAARVEHPRRLGRGRARRARRRLPASNLHVVNYSVPVPRAAVARRAAAAPAHAAGPARLDSLPHVVLRRRPGASA